MKTLMRPHAPIFAALLMLPLAADAAATGTAFPRLKPLADFRPGAWDMRADGGEPRTLCLRDPGALLTGGRPASGCTMTVLSDGVEDAALSYSCRSGRTGRTDLRRTASGLYDSRVQGVDGKLPFAARMEWRRTGDC